MGELIQHKGIILKIEKHTVFVKIEQQSACSACHAKSACLASDKKDKIIEVNDTTNSFKINEEVIVSAQSSMGMQAVILAFIIPLILVIAALFAGIKLTNDEAIGGIAGLAILIPYYFALYFFRDKIKKKFVFTISKISNTYQFVTN